KYSAGISIRTLKLSNVPCAIRYNCASVDASTTARTLKRLRSLSSTRQFLPDFFTERRVPPSITVRLLNVFNTLSIAFWTSCGFIRRFTTADNESLGFPFLVAAKRLAQIPASKWALFVREINSDVNSGIIRSPLTTHTVFRFDMADWSAAAYASAP